MKLVVVSVRDSAMESYEKPWFVPTTAVAVRAFRDEVARKESSMHGHPEDYILFEIASFDEDSGKFDNLPSPRQLIRGADCKET